MRALIVDDSKVIRVIVGRILKGIGWECVEACDGQDALDKLHASPDVSLALVDWNMPRLDGLAFVKAVRENISHEALRILMITSEAELERVQTALAAGADEYLMKPFTPEDVLSKLEILGFQS